MQNNNKLGFRYLRKKFGQNIKAQMKTSGFF